jgi:hypothetical protein
MQVNLVVVGVIGLLNIVIVVVFVMRFVTGQYEPSLFEPHIIDRCGCHDHTRIRDRYCDFHSLFSLCETQVRFRFVNIGRIIIIMDGFGALAMTCMYR